MGLTPGTHLGAYEIQSALGAGGMGEVYRATDTVLKRQVALKILPSGVAADPERIARFQREAEVLAALNHPNIAHLFGIEKSDGMFALAMELVEGQTLAERIAEGPISLAEALPIAKQIAEALETAHDQAIIHRDLKPANIKVRSDGTVKVLDFGLAKALDSSSGAAASDRVSSVRDLTSSPTLTTPFGMAQGAMTAMTGVGVILGTAPYMAPEQARGRAADKRSDIWAFGCVLFEMLTGRRAFKGDDITDTLANILKSDPEWTLFPADVPAPILTLTRRCLEKDRARRIADASTLRFVIDDVAALAGPAVPTTPAPNAPLRSSWVRFGPTAAFAAVALLLAWPAALHLREGSPAPAPEMRLDIATPPTSTPGVFALSPDGRAIVFAGSDGGRSKLWLRSLDRTTARVLPGTDDPGWPFWSPDGRSIGFFAGGKLLRLDLSDGATRVLADVPYPIGGAWAADGTIVYAPGLARPLMRVPASGGVAEPFTQLAPGQTAHISPSMLPDRRHYLFQAIGIDAASGLYLGTVGKPQATKLADIPGMLLPPDRVVLMQGGSLVVRRLDLETETIVGEPAILANGITANATVTDGVGLSAASNGMVAYRMDAQRRRALTWRDRSGAMVERLVEPGGNAPQLIALSPDGRLLASSRPEGSGNNDIWLLDIARKSETRFTFSPAIDVIQAWAPDSRRLAFTSNRTGTFGIYVGSTQQPGAAELLFKSEFSTVVQDWSSDGRFILYYETNPTTRRDIWAVDLASPDRRRQPVSVTPVEESLAQFSPDGRWVAYQTNASGRFEIVVKAFGGEGVTGGLWQVSRDGGVQPRWGHDGKELYFIAPDGSLFASTIAAGKDSLEVSPAVKLFSTTINGGGGVGSNAAEYAVGHDGRFLINEVVDGPVSPITIVLNPTL